MDVRCYISSYYESIVHALHYLSGLIVPRKRHGFYRYCWDEELTLLKEKSIQSFSIWASLGKLRTGTAFDEMKKDKEAYTLGIRTKEKKQVRSDYSDSLNNALMNKDMDTFWKSLRSTFGCKSSTAMTDGIFDDKGIANKFANVFESVSVPNSVDRHKLLETKFIIRFHNTLVMVVVI